MYELEGICEKIVKSNIKNLSEIRKAGVPGRIWVSSNISKRITAVVTCIKISGVF
jgi:predicted amino acid racemase